MSIFEAIGQRVYIVFFFIYEKMVLFVALQVDHRDLYGKHTEEWGTSRLTPENEQSLFRVWDVSLWIWCWPLSGHLIAGHGMLCPLPPAINEAAPFFVTVTTISIAVTTSLSQSYYQLIMHFHATTFPGTGVPTTVACGVAVGVPTVIVAGGLMDLCSFSILYLA